MTDRSGDPWSGATYNGFSSPNIEEAPEPPPRRRVSGRLIGAGIAVAVALGVGFGVLTRQDLGEEPGSPDRSVAAETAATGVPIEVAAVQPEPAPLAGAPMEVLPPDMARAAAARRVIRLPTPPSMTQRVPVAEVATAAPAVATSARVPEADLAAPRADPGFDCRYAGSRSERLVCGDAGLARLDRRLNRAFADAVASGVPYRSLRQDQDDWLRIREDAARQAGPDAVASVYRQRIAELNDLARDGNAPY